MYTGNISELSKLFCMCAAHENLSRLRFFLALVIRLEHREQAHVGARAQAGAACRVIKIERRRRETRNSWPLRQTPSCRIALLYAARAHDSKVSLRAG